MHKLLNPNQDDWLAELYNSRKSFVEISRENDFEHGIWQSTVDKYAEPDHFIYELLQNAEDQEATEVNFEMRKDCLIFSHNGALFGQANLFSRDDVKNITGIGNSNKPEQANKIGRFGIGFKSVFVVTDRPEIYTKLEGAPFAFAIENLVVPVALNAKTSEAERDLTTFILPFRENQAAKMYGVIMAKLRSLGADSLLFLEHLTQITWKTGAEHGTYLCERDWVPGTAWNFGRCSLVGEAILLDSKNYDEKTYLVFNKPTSMEGADRTLTVRIAFRLENGAITPETNVQPVNVYFPTEERVGLRFRLHAPFLLTDNRANIKPQEPLNRKLAELCAELLSKSLPQLRDLGLLSVSCLNCLPLQKTQLLGSVFLPLYEATKNTLMSERLMPVAEGEFAKVEQVKIAGTSALRALLDSKQLSQLFRSDVDVCWLSPQITEAEDTLALRRYLQQEVGVGVVTPDAFADKIDLEFVEKQSDAWLITFYGFLTGLEALWRSRISYYQPEGALREKPFIRLDNGSHTKPFRMDDITPNVSLPPKGETQFPIVKRILAQDEEALRFLKSLGLTQPDMTDEVLKMILPLYQSEQPGITSDVYKTHLEQISEALASSSDEKRNRLQEGLQKAYFVKAVNASNLNRKAWVQPVRRQVFVATTDTKAWFEGNDAVWFVDADLEQNPIWRDIAPHLNLISGIPTWRHTPYTYSSHGLHKRGLNLFDPTAETTGLEYAMSHMTPLRAKVLWAHLLKNSYLIGGMIETATRRDFSNAKKEHQWSELGNLCRNNEWLPIGKDGFCRPAKTFLSDLPEGFEKDTAAARALADQLGMKKPEIQQLAEKLGIAVEDMEIIQNNRDSFKRWMEKEKEAVAKLTQSNPQTSSGAETQQGNANDNKATSSAGSQRNQEVGNSDNQRSRLLSYVLPKSENDTSEQNGNSEQDQKQDALDNREAVNRAGVNMVLAWEAQAGRHATEMSHTHPGYDVESKNEAGEIIRYIEVKSRTGVWDQQGVTLSDTQFHEAQKRGHVYWLYIVENADREDAQLFRIQDPANHVEYFCFDSGWSGLSE